MSAATGRPGSPPDRLATLTEDLDGLAAKDLDDLTDAALGEWSLGLRRLADRLEGQWLIALATVDARGAAGADQGTPAPSTASWLRNRLRMGASAATSAVRTARALFRGPLTKTAQALCAGELSVAHASALAHGTSDLPAQVAAEAEPVLVAAARRLDPPRLRRVITHLQLVADPDGADHQAHRQHEQQWLWVAPTLEGMVALQGLLEPEAGQILLAALEPLARPANGDDTRSGGQRRADALVELARRNLEQGRLPQTGGVRPQLTVVVALDSLVGQDALGGDAGWAGPLAPEACRRLACDGRHHPSGGQPPAPARWPAPWGRPPGRGKLGRTAPGRDGPVAPVLGGAPSQPLDVGRASRVITPTQRSALAVGDGGCGFPACARPLAWCEGHHLVSWLDGGRTDLDNLALLCRQHHRAIHAGGWGLIRGPDGRLTAHPIASTAPAASTTSGRGLNPPRPEPTATRPGPGLSWPKGWAGGRRGRGLVTGACGGRRRCCVGSRGRRGCS
jgi:Domain of unknown function (DUF222)/HNH endonuclease